MKTKKQTPKQIESLDPAKVIETPSEGMDITWSDAPMTAKDWAKGFDDYAEMIRKKLTPFESRQNDPELKATYSACRDLVEKWCNGAMAELKDCPVLPESPQFFGEDYFGGMIHLQKFCTECAGMLRGKDKQGEPDNGGDIEIDPDTREQQWREDAPDYKSITDAAVNYLDNKITPSGLSRHLEKPGNTIRWMRRKKPAKRKVHVVDFLDNFCGDKSASKFSEEAMKRLDEIRNERNA
jgi:hypothetical protein